MTTLVVRFSSLGDLVLAGAVTSALGPVRLWTHARYAEIGRALVGVTEVVADAGDRSGALAGVTRVVDLQGSLRSRRALLGSRTPVDRVPRAALQRRLRVWFKRPPAPRVVDRYARAAGVAVGPRPWVKVPPGPPETTVLLPGAAWATKRWPVARWVALGRVLEGPLVVMGGPEEAALVASVAAGIGPAARAVTEAGFTRTLAEVGRARLAVGSDSGLLHLCAAAGVPAVGIFGPTTSSDGFWCHSGAVAERSDLACRPCSRFGGERCPVGDHACLVGLSVEAVRAAAVRALA